ncbi:TRAP transporter small permease [Afifella pfennigii]|uniref:TRAP transporter small permease n=1 Tax=Afifella pfennigii TaxID=209897 RepID=UPI00068A6D02|nr:TRAP transporter small permease [Afifella pfennigii]
MRETEPAGGNIFARADRLLSRAEAIFIGAAISFCSILLFTNVVLRYVFLAPISWAEELSIYLLVWIVFVGASVAFRTHSHIVVDMLPRMLPPAGRRIVAILAATVTAAFLAVFLYYSAQHTLNVRALGQLTPVMQAPMWLTYLAMPVGSALMLIRNLQLLAILVRSRADEEAYVGAIRD